MATSTSFFFPLGLQTLSVSDFNQIVKDLGAKMIIPINYKTDLSGIVPLRTLDDYLSAHQISGAQVQFRRNRRQPRVASRRADRLCPEVAHGSRPAPPPEQ